jgi:hypothetical protein
MDLKPTAKNSNDTAYGIADRLQRPVASMFQVLTPLTRCAMNEGARRTEASEVSLNFLEWRSIHSAEVVPHTTVMTVHGVLDLVDFEIGRLVGNLY